jgi:hypothetical protein
MIGEVGEVIEMFTRRRDKAASSAATVPHQVQASADAAFSTATGNASSSVTDADLRTCDERLRPLEVAIDADNPVAGNRAALALAIAGGYPSLTGKALFQYQVKVMATQGDKAFEEIDRKPWRWLASVASAAATGGHAERNLLAVRIALVAWAWRTTWAERFENEITKSVPAQTQFSEEVGLIPPPEDLYAPILSSGIVVLGPITDKNMLIRDHELWSVGVVTRLLAKDLAALHDKGVPVDPAAEPFVREALGGGPQVAL